MLKQKRAFPKRYYRYLYNALKELKIEGPYLIYKRRGQFAYLHIFGVCEETQSSTRTFKLHAGVVLT